MSKEINLYRHRFPGTAAMTLAAQFGMLGSAKAQSNKTKPADATTIKPGTNTSFGSLKQIDAGVLNVGYAEAGPANGRSPGKAVGTIPGDRRPNHYHGRRCQRRADDHFRLFVSTFAEVMMPNTPL